MRKLYVTALICIFLFNNAFSQGLIFDSAQFAGRTSVKITRGPLPKIVSLKKFTPIPYPQVASTCVAHTFSIAMTILTAKNLGLTEKQTITRLSFSPYYIYYRNKFNEDINCAYGLNVEAAARDVLKNGFAPLADVEYPNYYPFTKEALCIVKNGIDYPPTMEEDENAASNYKIDEIYTITTIQQLKTALSKGMPVVVILFPPPSFLKVKTDLWAPPITEQLNKNIMAHAVLAIGYNDVKYGGCVEIMNSWGDTWGNKSFASIKYKDYAKFFVGGYAFYMKDKAPLKNNVPPKKPFTMPLPPDKNSVSPTVIDVKTGYGNNNTKFNNKELIKAFKK